MRRLSALAATLVLAATASAQDTTVVIVRHIQPRQDTNVVVRHLAPPPAQEPRMAAPIGAPRYALRNAAFAKDPYLGSTLSFFFPGGGQYYAGREGKGLALTLLAIGAPLVGYANVNRQQGYYGGGGCPVYNGPGYPYGPGGGYCHDHTDWTNAAIGLGVGITAWIYGIATAGSDVQHWNQAHGVRFMTAPGRVGIAVPMP